MVAVREIAAATRSACASGACSWSTWPAASASRRAAPPVRALRPFRAQDIGFTGQQELARR